MSQPVVHVKVADPVYTFKWLRQLFHELRFRKNKIEIELIRPEGQKPFIQVTRKG